MGTKQQPGAFDCYEKAMPDEPMFTLLARDPRAAWAVRAWASTREYDIEVGRAPASDTAAVAEARQCADDMEKWRLENDGTWRQPRLLRMPVGDLPDVLSKPWPHPHD